MTRNRWVGPAVAVVGLTVAAVSLRHALPQPAEVWHTVKAADAAWLSIATVAQAGSIVMFALQQRRLLRAFGVSIPVGEAVAVTYARTAISIALPAGAAISSAFALRRFRSSGASTVAATAVILASGVQSLAALVLVYLAWFAGVGIAGHTQWSGLLIAASAVGTAVIALSVLPRWWYRHARGGSQRLDAEPRSPRWHDPDVVANRPWRRRMSAAVETVTNSLRSASTLSLGDWAVGGGYAMANWATDVACLLAVAHAIGLGLGLIAIVGAYLAVQLVRQLPLTPSGIGIVEASLLVALVTAGATNVAAAAVVLGYRLLSCWMVAAIGLFAWIRLRGTPVADDTRAASTGADVVSPAQSVH